MFNWIRKYFGVSYNLGKALSPQPLPTKPLIKKDMKACEDLFKGKINE